MPEISFREMLMVPDGPPEAVWERALDAAYAAPEEDPAPDDPSPAHAESDTNADFVASGGEDVEPGPATLHHGSAASAWDEGLGSENGDASHGDDGPDYGDGVGDAHSGVGDDVGY